MKKLVFSLAVLFSVAMVSCGANKAADNNDSADSAVVVEEEVAVAADSTDTVVAAEVAVETVDTPATAE